MKRPIVLLLLLASALVSCVAAMGDVHARPSPGPVAQAAPSSNPLAVLIVGDLSNKALRQKEEEVIALIRQSMAEQGLPKEVLPILTYHVNVKSERVYCEKVLKIPKSQLLFIGLAEHKNLVVKKVIVREPNVKNPETAVYNLFRQAVAIITGIPPEELPDPNGKPSPSPLPTRTPTHQPTEDPTPTGNADDVHIDQAVMCLSVDSRGAPRSKTDVYTPEDTFYVSMEVYGLQVGTVIEARWYTGRDLIKSARIVSDKVGDYYAWFSLEPESRWVPGRYRVAISINGQYKETVYFRVSESN